MFILVDTILIFDSDIYIWGVMVLGLDSHPGHNKGPDYISCPKTYPIDH